MFENELALQQKFIELKNVNKKENENLLAEFNARFGNVDIVEVIISNTSLLNVNQAKILSIYQHAKVLAFLHRKAVRTFNYLKKCTDYTDKSLCDTLSKLIRANIITEITKGRYLISSEFQFPLLQFISYEAKLSKWKKAILQATINKKFSSYSYVVLPLELAKKLQLNEIYYFQTFNVGLIGVSTNKLEYLFNPKKEYIKININPSLITSIAKYQLKTSTFSVNAF